MNTTLIAQLVKNLPAMQETLVRFLVWEDPLESIKTILRFGSNEKYWLPKLPLFSITFILTK